MNLFHATLRIHYFMYHGETPLTPQPARASPRS
jgi:hypothetical protein